MLCISAAYMPSCGVCPSRSCIESKRLKIRVRPLLYANSNRGQAYEWYHFQWSWVTSYPDFKVMTLYSIFNDTKHRAASLRQLSFMYFLGNTVFTYIYIYTYIWLRPKLSMLAYSLTVIFHTVRTDTLSLPLGWRSATVCALQSTGRGGRRCRSSREAWWSKRVDSAALGTRATSLRCFISSLLTARTPTGPSNTSSRETAEQFFLICRSSDLLISQHVRPTQRTLNTLAVHVQTFHMQYFTTSSIASIID